MDYLGAGAVLLLFASSAGYAIDGLAPTRKYAPGTSAAKAPNERKEDGTATGRNFDWWGFSPSSSKASRPAPGEAKAKTGSERSDGVSEMGVIASAEGDEVAMGRESGKKGPRVHGEAGIYGGGAGGTAVIEGDEAALTISGERAGGWWP